MGKEVGYNVFGIVEDVRLPGTQVSFSQYSKWRKCPRAWKLSYIDKIKVYEPSVHAVFGTAIHETIQKYLELLYTTTVKEADAFNIEQFFLERLKHTIQEEVEKSEKMFTTREELSEFYVDGVEILKFIKKKRKLYFDKKNETLIGIELPLLHPVNSEYDIKLQGYQDLITKDNRDDVYLLRDIKTSTRGWSDWDKKDEVKISQLLLYKIFLHKQSNIPLDKIRVEYFILRRKVDPDSAFPIRRVQIFEPAQSERTLKKTYSNFMEFIETCFNKDGTFKETVYPATAGLNCKNCRFCEYNNETHCPLSIRIQQ